MPATQRPASRASRLRTALGLSLLAGACVTLLLLMTAKHEPAAPKPVPSFDAPLGAFDPSKVPNGWAPLVASAARQAGIPAPVLAAQLEVESGWDPKAVSPVGAQGLAQFTPDTWKTYGHGDPFDPKDAIAAQGRLMRDLKRRADASGIHVNHVKLALAGYNAGFGNVTKHHGVPPFPETQAYVDSVAWAMGYYAKPLPPPSPRHPSPSGAGRTSATNVP